MNTKSGYISIAGCVEASSRVRGSHGTSDRSGAHFIRISEVKEICEATGDNRLEREVTKEEYDTIPSGDKFEQGDKYYAYEETSEISVLFRAGDTGRARHIGLLVPEGALSLKARIDEIEHPAEVVVPAEPVATRLGYAFTETNKAILAVPILRSLDSYSVIEFTVRAGSGLKAALEAPAPVPFSVEREQIPINTNPALPPFHALPVPGVGNVRVSRHSAGGALYFLGSDEAMSFGIEIHGRK